MTVGLGGALAPLKDLHEVVVAPLNPEKTLTFHGDHGMRMMAVNPAPATQRARGHAGSSLE